MENWQKVKIQDVCESISDGDHLPPPKADTGVPFVTIANIKDNQFDFTDTMFVPNSYYEKLDSKRKAKVGDILYSVVGSFGIPVLIKKENKFVFQRHIAILRPNKIDSDFLFYTMLNKTFYAKVDNVAVGAAQRTISLSALRNIEISLPPLPTQQKIASILSAYDNLIQNYKKQIEALQTTASELYKEWFIRFPGYQTTRFENGIPEGWRIETANKLFNITIGKTPPRAEQEWFSTSENDVKWVSISDMNQGLFIENTNEKLTKAAVDKFHVITVPKDTVLLSFKLTIGKVSITKFEVTTNEAIAHFHLPDLNWREYIYNYLAEFPYQKLGNTSAIGTAINSQIVKKMNIVVPDDIILKKYHKKAGDIFNKISLLGNQITNLTQQRDLLLPRLMSGKLEVE